VIITLTPGFRSEQVDPNETGTYKLISITSKRKSNFKRKKSLNYNQPNLKSGSVFTQNLFFPIWKVQRRRKRQSFFPFNQDLIDLIKMKNLLVIRLHLNEEKSPTKNFNFAAAVI
jgi:hypothetical protein